MRGIRTRSLSVKGKIFLSWKIMTTRSSQQENSLSLTICDAYYCLGESCTMIFTNLEYRFSEKLLNARDAVSFSRVIYVSSYKAYTRREIRICGARSNGMRIANI